MPNKKILLLGTIYILCSAFFICAEQAEREIKPEPEEINSEYLQNIEYLKAFNESSLSSHRKLTLMHKKSNLAKLGKEKVCGNISGTCEY